MNQENVYTEWMRQARRDGDLARDALNALPDDAFLNRKRTPRRIIVFQKVPGYGTHERIRDVQSMRILIQIDGSSDY
jgi:hypothetical protein